MKIIYTSRFARSYKKLTSELKEKAKEQEEIFRENPFDNRLKTHKLNGNLDEFYSFSIDSKRRIIFEMAKDCVYYFHLVGDHDIYE